MEKTATSEMVQLIIPFQALADAVSKLNLKDKNRLCEILYAQIEQEEEDLLEQDPEIAAEIEQARAELEAGKYVTFDEYDAKRSQVTE